jgi:hypothetical protein
VDVTGRLAPQELGELVSYRLTGGRGTGGQPAEQGVVDASGTASAFDLVTGEELWSIPIASDERWQIAGGRVVGFSEGRMFGIG